MLLYLESNSAKGATPIPTQLIIQVSILCGLDRKFDLCSFSLRLKFHFGTMLKLGYDSSSSAKQ